MIKFFPVSLYSSYNSDSLIKSSFLFDLGFLAYLFYSINGFLLFFSIRVLVLNSMHPKDVDFFNIVGLKLILLSINELLVC